MLHQTQPHFASRPVPTPKCTNCTQNETYGQQLLHECPMSCSVARGFSRSITPIGSTPCAHASCCECGCNAVRRIGCGSRTTCITRMPAASASRKWGSCRGPIIRPTCLAPCILHSPAPAGLPKPRPAAAPAVRIPAAEEHMQQRKCMPLHVLDAAWIQSPR